MAKRKPVSAEKRFLAGLSREERRRVRFEDAGRKLAENLVVVGPEPKEGQQPPRSVSGAWTLIERQQPLAK